jgi:thiol-disulfide isomerase/thioredoxin
MKYLLLSAFLFFSMSVMADKKKSKNKKAVPAVIKSSSSADGSEPTMVTVSSEMQSSDSFVGHLEATRIEAPLFNFKGRDWRGKAIGTEDFHSKNLIVMLYNPDCGHCMEVAGQILNNLESMPNTQVLLISGEATAGAIPEFMKTVGIDSADTRFTIGLIDKVTTEEIFEYNGIPQVMIYTNGNLLRKVYYRGVNMAEIKKITE